ncbi:hypothetical protein [Paludisphaera mucosa]|uniref:Cytochrome c domain-containing protein n=1 Tax=Paludisphaera mucosa TaxID=3030827 RepID=A0ABT6F8U9_9BACT|nr:hypothetical protein [Paludisphaera mucosa]MDG3004012.1 hypothetical protein [Paludisphaera mucosa]
MAQGFMAAGLVASCIAARADLPYDREPINYLTAEAHDPVAGLKRLVESKQVVLEKEGPQGYLRAVLRALDVPVSSQVLVFSKTSFQVTKISPRSPRALYFNDEVYVGFVQGSDTLEFSAVDPELGGVFYLIEQKADGPPEIERRTHDCLQCHVSGKTQDVPGHMVRSIQTDPTGRPVFSSGSFTSTHESPLKERWGGWYVTGKAGGQAHMGNVLTPPREKLEPLEVQSAGDVLDLAGRLSLKPYLSPHSDIVALLVLEHQVKMQNLITVANYQAKLAIQYAREISKAFGELEGTISESTARRYEGPAEQLVKYMLFVDEAPLAGRVEGSSAFAAEFAARGPRDPQGRSLRDFDLTTRLFKYPCSYLIYSKAFDALPAPVKERTYRRLWDVLTGKDPSPAFARRTPEERRAILEILLATKPGLPDYWRASP